MTLPINQSVIFRAWELFQLISDYTYEIVSQLPSQKTIVS